MISGEEEEGRRASLAGLRGLVLLTRALSTSLLPAVAFHLCTSCSALIFTSFPVTEGFVLPLYAQKSRDVYCFRTSLGCEPATT